MSQIRYKRGYKYQLVERVRIQLPWAPTSFARVVGPEAPLATLTPEGWLIIEPLYACDGPSGPTLDTRDFMGAAIVHDCLYQMIRLEQLPREWRSKADSIMWRLCRGAGMNWFRAGYCYLAVRWFARYAARPESEPKVLTAPLVLAEVK